MKTTDAVPCYDLQRRTCLQVARDKEVVRYMPLDISEGLDVLRMATTDFDRRYMPMVDYPADRAAQLYLSYAQTIGATDEALDALSQIITITPQEKHMATNKKRVKTDAVAAKTKKDAKKVAGPAKTKKIAPGEKRETAAQLFQDLIMAGGATDDQIFKKVQTKFGLDDKKRGYVKWYRNHLEKAGKKPPKAKE